MSRSFDGVDDDVQVATPEISTGAGVTVSCVIWLRPNTASNNARFLYFDAGTTGISFVWNANSVAGNVGLINPDEGAGIMGGSSGNGVWHWIYGQITNTTEEFLLIDGTSVSTATGAFAGNNNDNILYLGIRPGSLRYAGLLAHCQIWNRALTFYEANQAAFYPGSVRNSLRIYLPLWGQASPEPDLSGFIKNGTVNGATLGSDPPPGRFAGRHRRYGWGYRLPVSVGATFSQNVTDNFTFSDSISKNALKYLTDNITISDSLSKNFTKYLTDSVEFREDTYKNVLKFLSDNITLADATYKIFLKQTSDSITFSDDSYFNFLKYVQDNITLTESLEKNIVKYVADNITTVDSANASLVTNLIRTLTFLTIRSMLGTRDKLDMEGDLNVTAFTKLEHDDTKEDLVSTGLSKMDVDSMEHDSDSTLSDS